MKQNDEIEDLFQSNFDDFSVEPPQNVKSAIDEKLFNTVKGYKGFWIFLSTFIFVASIIGFLLYNSSSIVNSSSSSIISKKANTSIKKSSQSSKSEEQQIVSLGDKEKNDTTENNSNVNSIIETKKESSMVLPSKQATANENFVVEEVRVAIIKTTKKANKENVSKNKFLISKNINKNTGNLEKNGSEIKSNKTDSIGNSSLNVVQNGNNKKAVSSIESSNNNISNLDAKADLMIDVNKGNDNLINSPTTDKASAETSVKEISSVSSNDLGEKKVKDSISISILIKDVDTNVTVGSSEKKITDKPLVSSSEPPLSSWIISMRSGTSIASNKLNQTGIKSTERNALFVNVEASHFLKNNFSLSSGVQFNKYSNEISKSIVVKDSVINSIDTTFVISLVDSVTIIDSIINIHYAKTTSTLDARQFYNQMSFSVPIYLGYSQKVIDHFYFDINGGAILSYQQAKLVSTNSNLPDPTIRNFGVKVCLRPQIRYQFEHFGISISSNFGYDLMPTLNWSGVTRKRFYSEFGIGIHYKF